MLFVQFYLDEYRYVLSTKDVIEVIPGIRLTPVPKVPAYISGLCNYRGQSVPVIDLCELFLDRASNRKLSTRIVFIEAGKKDKGPAKVIGLMVEKATETIKIDEDLFMDAGVYNADAPFIGPVVANDAGLVTRILPDEIFLLIDGKLLFESA